MANADTDAEQAHLALLVAKHQEQSQLFYSRVQVLLVVYGFLFAAAGAIITSSTLAPGVAYFSLAVLTLVGSAFSFTWRVVIKESNDWIRFWEAKIILFEINRQTHSDPLWDFFRDRERTQKNYLDTKTAFSVDSVNEGLKLRWHRPVTLGKGGRIGRIFQGIPDLMGILWLILLLVVLAMCYSGVSLHEHTVGN